MEELITEDLKSGNNINNIPLTMNKFNLKKLSIGTHLISRNYERLGTYYLTENDFWKKLDEILLKNYQRYYSLISSSINFCCLLNNKNEYYKVIIGFNNKESLYIATIISINKNQYEKLKNNKMYYDSNKKIHYVIW